MCVGCGVGGCVCHRVGAVEAMEVGVQSEWGRKGVRGGPYSGLPSMYSWLSQPRHSRLAAGQRPASRFLMMVGPT